MVNARARFRLSPRSILLVALLAAPLAVLIAQGVDAAWKVPLKEAARQNPLRARPEAAAGGGKLFERHCVTCHGDASHPRSKGAPDLALAEVQAESDGALFWRMSSGNSRTAMPSFSSLPEAQRWQLVMYLRTLARASTKAAEK